MSITGTAIIAIATVIWGWLLLRVYPKRFGLPGAPMLIAFWAFTLDIAAVVVAMFLEMIGLPLLIGAEDALINGEYTLFIVLMVGMVVLFSPLEEFSKYAMFRMSLVNRRQFWGVHRGAVIGAAVGLGFACVENIGYMLSSSLLEPEYAGYMAAYRSVIGFPIHALLGMIMGGYLGRWKAGGGKDAGLALRALLLPSLVHVAYNVVAISPLVFSIPSDFEQYSMDDLFYSGGQDLFMEMVYLAILLVFIGVLFLVIDRRLRSEKLIPAQGSVESQVDGEKHQ